MTDLTKQQIDRLAYLKTYLFARYPLAKALKEYGSFCRLMELPDDDNLWDSESRELTPTPEHKVKEGR